MESKYKTLIPLIIIFFILGAVLGYVAHKPNTIEIEKPVERIVYQYVTVTPTPTPVVTAATSTPTETPVISDFTVKNYDPSKDTPTKTIELTSNGANPGTLSIRPVDSVLIKITGYSLQSSLTLNLTSLNMSQERNLGTSGAAIVTFNKKGSYSFKAIIPSDDPNILPKTYAEGTITVY